MEPCEGWTPLATSCVTALRVPVTGTFLYRIQTEFNKSCGTKRSERQSGYSAASNAGSGYCFTPLYVSNYI